MSIYITVYVILGILLLLLINFRVINHKKPSKSLTKMINEEEKEKFAYSEPVLEYVEADVQPQESLNKRKKQSAAETEKDSGTGKILVALMLGAFVAILNQTLLNVAIPHIMNDLGVSANTVQWLTTGYMLVNGIAIPVTAFLIEKFGTRKLF
ncbi:MAG: MFS transporter, partial [Neobacillus sp.]